MQVEFNVPVKQARQLGLTTRSAAFIEEARGRGELYIEQPYELYSEENHAAWAALYRRMQPLWREYGNPFFLRGLETLALDPERIPRLVDVNARLSPLTGFRARAVSGYVPAYLFLDCLRRREFPTTITIRPATDLDYLPEPDIFHDVAGHVPMHTDKAFASALAKFGDCAQAAARHAAQISDPLHRAERLIPAMRALARVFWFTVEFGLIRGEGGRVQACGSGLLSSYGELQHSIESPKVHREPFRLEWAIHQAFEIDHYQPLLMVLDSFGQLFEVVNTLERWIGEGRLDAVAGGEPEVNERDLQSFLDAAA